MIHPGFTSSEYQARVSALQRKLKDRSMAGAILTSEANYNYFAGYHHFAPWTTFCRPVFCFVPSDADPTLLIHGFPAADARRDVWFDDVRSYDSLTFAPIAEVVAICQERGLLDGPIGMELGAEHRIAMTAHEWDALRDAIDRPIEDIGDAIWDLRIIKSAAEIHHLKESGRIAAAAFARCFEQARAGMTEAEIANALGSAIAEEGGRVGFFIMTSGRGYYDRVAGLPRDRVLEPGDFLWIDLGVTYRGYWTDHCRAAVVGPASAQQLNQWSSITGLTWAAVEQCRSGMTAADLVRFIEDEGKRMGLDFSFEAGRSGHGIGLMSTEPPHIALYDDTELRDGMAFTIEPGWIEQELGVFVSEENLVLRDGRADMITVTPRELIEL